MTYSEKSPVVGPGKSRGKVLLALVAASACGGCSMGYTDNDDYGDDYFQRNSVSSQSESDSSDSSPSTPAPTPTPDPVSGSGPSEG